MIYPYRHLFKTSIIAAPLMGLSVMFTLYFKENLPTQNIIILTFFVTIILLLIWISNIGILKLLELNNKKYFRYLISAITILIITIIVINSIEISKYYSDSRRNIISQSIYFFQFNNLVILFIIDLIISKKREEITLIENTQLRIKNLEAQQLQLRQQIQPHFLFNSLNTLKSLISKHPVEAEEYLVKLSSFLRYNLSSNSQDLILLKDELEICSEYLEILKVRFTDALKYSLEVNDQNALNSKVPIFAIQLLIENAIKHNVLTNENPLRIEITITEINKISVCNNFQEKMKNEKSTQIGLKNLSERYKILINKDIQIIKTLEKFEVLLPLA